MRQSNQVRVSKGLRVRALEGKDRVCTWVPVGLVDPNLAVAAAGRVIRSDRLLLQGLLRTSVGLLEVPVVRVGKIFQKKWVTNMLQDPRFQHVQLAGKRRGRVITVPAPPGTRGNVC